MFNMTTKLLNYRTCLACGKRMYLNIFFCSAKCQLEHKLTPEMARAMMKYYGFMLNSRKQELV